ncbi:DUF397 domain-containing protein [Nocardia cyriacigeorgica]|uniref:DUF397 domain-containing protein n=1 Tax=Nocardia cyriacigeorgica TaxID=135487 RepID=A0A6P1D2H7_9NOCA|nr:DUF397 domain-containing protein [Nocardia cyriacigeorgica]NEW38405.1 DUF397 domain-containing protein [Nocardia cyriacigeorgica]NEW43631.1 DUF397 domain-containing protein [Nocardia cyriacigeorgica]NEW49433.1 DUF397 domain-containing protein [Nocardia cyriacigeorgica]NEW54163.1 DUF397 domain-containing protein [Nocardia cyriacigeorgica]
MAITAKYRPHASGWFTSSRSNNGNQCVEVRFDGDAVLIRDSKYRRNPANRSDEEPVITVTACEWTAFIDTVSGRGHTTSVLTVHTAEDGHTRLGHGATTLTYTPEEWEAFLAGATDGEFDRIILPA